MTEPTREELEALAVRPTEVGFERQFYDGSGVELGLCWKRGGIDKTARPIRLEIIGEQVWIDEDQLDFILSAGLALRRYLQEERGS